MLHESETWQRRAAHAQRRKRALREEVCEERARLAWRRQQAEEYAAQLAEVTRQRDEALRHIYESHKTLPRPDHPGVNICSCPSCRLAVELGVVG